MKLPTFNAAEISTLQRALSTLNSEANPEHISLVNKLSQYESVSHEHPDVQIVLSTTLQNVDSDEEHSSEVNTFKDQCRYSFNIEAEKDKNAYYFSVYNQELDKVAHESSLSGLFGVIEIRNGKPVISIGITPDEFDMQISSNNSTQLSMLPDLSGGHLAWESVAVNKFERFALVLTVDDEQFLNEQRRSLASTAFGEYDFGNLIVDGDDNWEQEGALWKKTVYFQNGNNPTSKGEFSVDFEDSSSFILSSSHKANC
jgi:hypothetical protein